MYRADARPAALLLGLVGVIAAASSPTADAAGASRSAQTAPVEFEIVVGPPDTGATPAVPADAVSLFVAIEEQLGLKLEPREAPFEVLVIRNAEKPEPTDRPRHEAGQEAKG